MSRDDKFGLPGSVPGGIMTDELRERLKKRAAKEAGHNGTPQAAIPVQVTTTVTDLAPAERAQLEAADGVEPDDFVAISVDVAQFQPTALQPDGTVVWQLQIVTPPNFFKFQSSRILDPTGVQTGIRQLMSKGFRSGKLPVVRLLVRRDVIGDHIELPPVLVAEQP